jgi:1-acyl-sn-glycerol-3-phosphate acyltransferase
MFERLKTKRTIIYELAALLDSKNKNINDKKILISTIKKQLSLIKTINRKSIKTDQRLLANISSYLSDSKKLELLSELGELNKTQENVLIDSLTAELKKIREYLASIESILLEQKKLIEKNIVSNEFTELRNKESVLISELMKNINQEDGFKKKIFYNLKLVKKLEHNETFMKLAKGAARLVTLNNQNILVTGPEIPETGPVIIAPRHYHGDYDPVLFYSVIKRKIFFLGATDWMKKGAEVKVNKFIFKKIGVVPVTRPDSKFVEPTKGIRPAEGMKDSFESIVRLLMLDQAVVIFPEGWPNIDAHWTKKKIDSGVEDIKAGLFHFVDYVQKRRNIRIPIIPVGVRYEKYENPEKKTEKIIVNIGERIEFPLEAKRSDYKSYMDILKREISRLSKE